MTVRELYFEAIKGKHYSLQLLIEFLVNEKNVIKMTDDTRAIDYYLQERFHNKMNEYLAAYEEKRLAAQQAAVAR
jgi:hypothetical protein